MRLSSLIILGLGLGLTAYAFSGESVYKKIESIKNNNPTNIKHSSDQWLGMTNPQTDSVFVSFVSPLYGIRAAAKNLKTYFSKGLNTVSKIITTWAPPIENNTESYIAQVSQELGVNPSDVLTYNEATVFALVTAIIRREMGVVPFSNDTILNGIRMA